MSRIEIAMALTLKEVYHVAHPHPSDWTFILDALRTAGLVFKRVPPVEWLGAVEEAYRGTEGGEGAMLGMWRAAVSPTR